MKFTLAWLKEHLETGEPLDRIVDKLTMTGLEVERVDNKAKTLAPFTIARVISAEQHPNADRLRVCTVGKLCGEREVLRISRQIQLERNGLSAY